MVSLPTGPVNVAVIRNTISISKRMGIFLGAGAALVDAMYSLLVFLGFDRLVKAIPWAEPFLGAVGCVLMVIYGLLTVLRPTGGGGGDPRRPQTDYAKAFGLGALMTVANPGPLLAWLVIAPSAMGGLSTLQAILFSLGVLAGGLTWFTVLAELAHRGIMKIGRVATMLTRFVGLALVIFGLYLGTKAYLRALELLTG
ncbi:MAG: LysE family transporter [Polyangia bacterium]|nr:LysE family transporter [Polyangia bacterium]